MYDIDRFYAGFVAGAMVRAFLGEVLDGHAAVELGRTSNITLKLETFCAHESCSCHIVTLATLVTLVSHMKHRAALTLRRDSSFPGERCGLLSGWSLAGFRKCRQIH